MTQAGKALIYARISINGKRVEISAKELIEPENWNAVKGCAKGSRQEFTLLNQTLEKLRSAIVDGYHSLVAAKKPVTADLFKNSLLGAESDQSTLAALLEYHRNPEKSRLDKGTLKNYKTTEKYLNSFLKTKLKVKNLSLGELNYKFICDFEAYLRAAKNKHGEYSMNNDGAMKHLERLCKLARLAVKLEWIDKYPFHAYQTKFDAVERDYLTALELRKIEQTVISTPRLRLVKDLFIFSCYTGLSYIEAFNLNRDNIVELSPGEFWIKGQREKTNIPYMIPLLPKALQILEAYHDHPVAVAKGKLLPMISNQKFNKYIKEVAALAGIRKKLTHHIARHTFATTVTLTNNVPMETISKMLGHTKLSTTQIYAKVVQSKVKDDMAKLRTALQAAS